MHKDTKSPLSPDQVLYAYRNGLFPMAVEEDRIGWFSPDPRGIIPLDAFHLPRRLARVIRRGAFQIRVDSDFEAIIDACARHVDTWISADIKKVYTELHRLGYAHSVEAWQGGRLVGGLYGVSLGGAFFGESMFHRVTDASKIALAALVDRLRERGYRLLDTQWLTEHLAQFGAIELPRREYLRLLRASLALDCSFV
ncbi:MAG: leucyl/phenylalanyl-tRNA--protein transferase [Acidobacteria bacterium]|nr:leucyl/phenylalanyl-tRNA--protein transferase [Acidobacteriota bacterium]